MSLQAVKTSHTNLSEPDITNYWQHYGLKSDPFAVELRDDGYFPIPRWEEHLDLLQFLCHYNNVLLVVAGNSSSGKSTLARQFHKQVQDSMRVCEIKANSSFSPEQLIQTLSEQFHVTLTTEATHEEQLDQLIATIQESQKICLVLVDDAHLLSNPVLNNMLYLLRQQSESQMKLHILLFGEPHLQNNLIRVCQAQGEGEDLIHTINLGLFSLDETEKYLEYRLTKAGFDEMPLIQTVINRIYKLSAGAPGRINRIARRTLLNDLTKRLPEVKEGFMRKNQTRLIGGTLFILMAAVLSVAIHSFRTSNGFGLTPDQPSNTLMPLNQVSGPGVNSVNDGLVHAAITPLSAVPAPVDANMTSESAPPLMEDAPSLTGATPLSVPAPVPAQETLSVTSTEPVAATTTSAMAQDNRMLQATLAAANSLQPVSKSEVTQPKTPVVDANFSPEARLLAIPSTQFGLQLSGLRKEAAVKRFIADNKLIDKASYYHTQLNGNDWYVIIYGQFKSPADAKAAISNLPEDVQSLKPWVRSYASIHTAIKQAAK